MKFIYKLFGWFRIGENVIVNIGDMYPFPTSGVVVGRNFYLWPIYKVYMIVPSFSYIPSIVKYISVKHKDHIRKPTSRELLKIKLGYYMWNGEWV